ncbi:hypothetical protein BHU72_14850 [Desulfuribacillus stibiiarsenatis]|uniref:Stage III sporulation protein AC n=1 Tax=Desulfuribacillus stibiiarsenatis TaxID=1390249 RepID=A0A1E5L7R8_9FIRM|nr:hypothetical protein [Desulfuribacillus stibiiarsenatis]OEH86029.1 hypothetical protein BHU72_14850 [Desulfuribacillus stibiiarsenatis]
MVFLQIISVVVIGQFIVFSLDEFKKKDIASLVSILIVFISLGLVLGELLEASERIASLFKKEGG